MEFACAATSTAGQGGVGVETELKITVDAARLAALRRHPELALRRITPRRSAALVSVYYDTPGHALAAAGIGLRLRRAGRRWVQTIKRGRGGFGLFANAEVEVPAPGGRLVLEGPDPEGLLAAIAEAAGGAPLSPVFETRVRRVTERLRAPGGAEVELALDAGEIVAGDAHLPIHEVELELKAGDVGGLYELARLLFPTGPVQFSAINKAARGYRLARGEAEPAPAARNAGTPAFAAGTTVEAVARDVFRDCFAQIAANMALVAGSDAPEGPHQLRVGLRRLRAAVLVFRDSLGAEALRPLSEEARRLGGIVGPLRDLDVLIGVVADAAALGLDDGAREALIAALDAHRGAVRKRVRRALAAPAAVGFLFDLGRLIEGRGWLAPADYAQSARLATPIGEIAADLLDARLARVTRRGRRIRALDPEGLHALRKQRKKLRYAADLLAPIVPGKRVARYLRALRTLQDGFGSLNDAAMAASWLSGPGAPATDAPAVQRAAGWVLGSLAVRTAHDRPRLFEHWDALARAKPFWR
jgi:inorganic triphosphatase YgiF